MPIPISKKTSAAIVAILEEHGIEYWPSSMVSGSTRRATSPI